MARRQRKSGPISTSFASDVNAWVTKTETRMTETMRESARILADEMRGNNMPVVTGNLRNSLTASLAGMPSIDWSKHPPYSSNDAQIESVISGAEISDNVSLGFRAPYARKIEDKRGFVRLTVQRWRQIVEQAVARAKSIVP